MRPDRPEHLPSKIAAAIDRLARARRIRRQTLATHHGLSPLQIDLLVMLADGPPPPSLVGALAVEAGVSQPTVSDAMRALERKGLVERHHDDSDARRSPYRLTAGGLRLAETIKTSDAELTAAVEQLPVPVQEATLESLLAVIAQLVRTGVISVARTCFTCHHHRQDGTAHRCTLLDVDLPPPQLRVNCPEHEPAAGVGR